MRQLLILLASFALVGCATGPMHLPIAHLEKSERTPVQDLRPEQEGHREIFSLMITSEQYGYARLAQDLTDPTGPRLFAHRLQEKYERDPPPPTKLLHFAVYLNNRAELKSISLGAALGGGIGAGIASGGVLREGEVSHTLVRPESFASVSGDAEFKRAFYTDSELRPGTSAFVIFIETETLGVRRFTRTVSPTKPSFSSQRAPLHAALDSAIHFHLNP